ncbi:MAG: UDP-N-acetylmuramoyl-tripeptide--D-alanyl-D-alanine ligase [Patescibacteria group bacterium]
MSNKIIVFLFWALPAIRQILLWVYWLQVKEYRFDRFLILLETKEGRERLEIKFILLKFFVIFIILFFGNYWPAYLLLGWFNLRFLSEVIKKTIRIPKLTLRALELVGTSLLGVIIVFLLTIQSGIIISNLSLGEMLIVVLPFVGILWTAPLVNKTKQKLIKKAQERLKIVKPIVIGVTGSFGKSTTKEFVAHLLSFKYKVEKTEKNLNTDWGVANAAANLSKNTQVFVCELGAYKKGEIKSSCEIVHPKIGVITGIEPQHLSLFGSMENLKKAKYELVESLPLGGLAIFNATNEGAHELSERAKSKGRSVITYGVDVPTADLYAKIKKITTESVTADIKYEDKQFTITAPIRGEHFLQNLLAAIVVARELKVDWEKIKDAIKSIHMTGKTMHIYKVNTATVIDDSYNSTPNGFGSAIKYLSRFKNKRRVIITSGIIELGEKTQEILTKLAKESATVADEIVLINPDFEDYFKEAVADTRILKVAKGNALLDRLKYNLFRDCVILIEGRMPSIVTRELEKYK